MGNGRSDVTSVSILIEQTLNARAVHAAKHARVQKARVPVRFTV